MSNSTDLPSSSQHRAARNPYKQTAINNTLAVFLAEHNLPIPDSLKRAAQGEDRQLRSNKRCKHVEDVCSRFLVSEFSLVICKQNGINETASLNLPPLPPNDDTFDHQSPPPYHQQALESALASVSEGSLAGTSSIDDINLLGLKSPIGELKKTAQFIDALRGATLEQSNMKQDDIDRLRAAEPDPRLDVTDRHFIKAFHAFVSTTNALQATYNTFRSGMIKCYLDDPFLSFDQLRRCIEQLSGVVLISHDMCKDTCVGFTGPLADSNCCPLCGKDQYRSGLQEPHQQFINIPLGPVLQALYNLPEFAENMHYRK